MTQPDDGPDDATAVPDPPAAPYDARAVGRARELLDRLPDHIGRYRVLEHLGGGGMGEVYRAEQRTPVRREVAVKLIKLGMDTKGVIARFEAERQALAMMDHPNIAKVFDADADDTGRPYFVMEYVKGRPITEYADANHLTIAERVGLFSQVCSAIQHAHHKGVIHRDLKPGNVLVGTLDGRPHAKVIDFGIAKATHQRLTDHTLFTQHEQWLGTPLYMSPEQAEGSLDIDTRTDVYSLGVLLYELLTGSTPFTAEAMRAVALDGVKRLIRETDPPRPSQRISTSGRTLSTLAASRRADVAKLGALVRNELDWIVMKALEKDRARRYATPAGVAEDLQRYLAGEPVAAGPPGWPYRARKFVRRYRASITAAATATALLVVGLFGTGVGLIRERAAKLDAVAARTEATDARAVAEQQRADAQRQNDTLLRQSYDLGLQAAQQALSVGELDAARSALHAAPAALRGWEWHYLHDQTVANAGEFVFPDKTEFLAASADGGHFLLRDLSADGTALQLRRAGDGGLIDTLRLPDTGRVVAAAVSAGGRRVAVLTTDAGKTQSSVLALHVRDAASGRVVLARSTDDGSIGTQYAWGEGSLSLSADGRRVAVCGFFPRSRLDAAAKPSPDEDESLGTTVFDLDTPARQTFAVVNPGTLTEDGRFLIGGQDVAEVYDLNDLTRPPTAFRTAWAQEARLTGDPTTIAVLPKDANRWQLFDLATHNVVRPLSYTYDGSTFGVYHANATRGLAINDGELALWRVGIGGSVRMARVPGDVAAVRVDDAAGTLNVFASTKLLRYPLPSDDGLTEMIDVTARDANVSPDGRYLIQSIDDTAFVRDAGTFGLVGAGGLGEGRSFSGDGRTVSHGIGNAVVVSDFPSCRRQSVAAVPDPPGRPSNVFDTRLDPATGRVMALSINLLPDLREAYFLTCFEHGKVRSHAEVARDVRAAPASVGWLGDDAWVLVDQDLRCYDVTTGKRRVPAEPLRAQAAALSSDRKTIARVDGTLVTLIDASTRATIRSWRVPRSGNTYAVWTPDDRRLLIGLKGSVAVCDPQTGHVFVTIANAGDTVVAGASASFVGGRVVSAVPFAEQWANVRREVTARQRPHAEAVARRRADAWRARPTPMDNLFEQAAEDPALSAADRYAVYTQLRQAAAKIETDATAIFNGWPGDWPRQRKFRAAGEERDVHVRERLVEKLESERIPDDEVVCNPFASATAYRTALDGLQEAAARDPQAPRVLNFRAYGEFRTGDVAAARKTLALPRAIDAGGPATPAGGRAFAPDFAFLAMIHARSGEHEQAVRALAAFRRAYADMDATDKARYQDLGDEAATAVDSPTARPSTGPNE